MNCCHELRQLLETNWREDEAASNQIATHIRSCPNCLHGMIQLVEALLSPIDMPLSCDECRDQFPDYYEATRPEDEYPLATMAPSDLAEMAFHLAHCANCHEVYEVFVSLAQWEEAHEPIAASELEWERHDVS